MSRFAILDTPMAGLKLIERRRVGDNRGSLSRLFCTEELAAAGWRQPIAQINHTSTVRRGTVRGMHFQYPPHAEMKLVTCIRGRIWDVAVDLRAGSETFLQWHGGELSADNNRAMLIPERFAHGFQSLTDDVELLYCHSAVYHAEAEAGLHPEDARLAIGWPIPIVEMSARDARHPAVDLSFVGLVL